MKSSVYEYSQTDFHVQQRKKKLAAYYLYVHSCNSFPPLFSYLSERIRQSSYYSSIFKSLNHK